MLKSSQGNVIFQNSPKRGIGGNLSTLIKNHCCSLLTWKWILYKNSRKAKSQFQNDSNFIALLVSKFKMMNLVFIYQCFIILRGCFSQFCTTWSSDRDGFSGFYFLNIFLKYQNVMMSIVVMWIILMEKWCVIPTLVKSCVRPTLRTRNIDFTGIRTGFSRFFLKISQYIQYSNFIEFEQILHIVGGDIGQKSLNNHTKTQRPEIYISITWMHRH